MTIRTNAPASKWMRFMMSAVIAASVANWRGSTTSGFIDPNIEVVDVDLAGDRRLMLRHAVVKGAQLVEADTKPVLQHLADLWGYEVVLREVDSSDVAVKEQLATPLAIACDPLKRRSAMAPRNQVP